MAARWVLVALLSSAAVAACAQGEDRTAAGDAEAGREAPVAEATYKNITPTELQGMLGNKDFELVNVHVPFEGDLPQTDRSIPFNEIDQHLDQLPADKNARIVLYCRSGSMSVQAASTLARLGYTNVFNLSGGFNAWRDAGLPLEGI